VPSTSAPLSLDSGSGRLKDLVIRWAQFQVRAMDAAGNVDPTADRDKFKVVD
jgi:hypothetical protein